jgi:hypothetical protein
VSTIELRGYEVARFEAGRWIEVSRWRPNDYALNQALEAAVRLNERQPNQVYAVRPVISVAPPQPAAPPPSEPLHLTEDLQLELPFDVSDVKETE